MTTVEPFVERLYRLDELLELRRTMLRYARSFPPGDERNQHLHVAVSLRTLFKNEEWLRDHVRKEVSRAHSSKSESEGIERSRYRGVGGEVA